MAREQKIKKSKIAWIAVIVFTVYVLVSVTMIYFDIRQRNNEIADLTTQIKEQEILNQEIQKLLDAGVDKEYIVKMAREKLGLVFEDERVYVDVAGE